jgi:hypothetical protein
MDDAMAVLYDSGLSIREVARRTGMSFHSVRYRLARCGLHRIKHKHLRDGMATCKRCGEEKAAEQFPNLRCGRYLCQVCLRAEQAEQQLRRQGSSSERYRELLEAQNTKCAICGVMEGHRSRYGKVCRLAVDHDHRTGKVRGLLCNNCNRGLGRFKDSIENLEAALRYLKREQ